MGNPSSTVGGAPTIPNKKRNPANDRESSEDRFCFSYSYNQRQLDRTVPRRRATCCDLTATTMAETGGEHSPLLLAGDEPSIGVESATSPSSRHRRALVVSAGSLLGVAMFAATMTATRSLRSNHSSAGMTTLDGAFGVSSTGLGFEVHNKYTKSTGVAIGVGYPWLVDYRLAEPYRDSTLEVTSGSSSYASYVWTVGGDSHDLTSNGSHVATVTFYEVRVA